MWTLLGLHIFVAPWLHTYRTSLGTGMRTALDAVLLLTQPSLPGAAACAALLAGGARARSASVEHVPCEQSYYVYAIAELSRSTLWPKHCLSSYHRFD